MTGKGEGEESTVENKAARPTMSRRRFLKELVKGAGGTAAVATGVDLLLSGCEQEEAKPVEKTTEPTQQPKEGGKYPIEADQEAGDEAATNIAESLTPPPQEQEAPPPRKPPERGYKPIESETWTIDTLQGTENINVLGARFTTNFPNAKSPEGDLREVTILFPPEYGAHFKNVDEKDFDDFVKIIDARPYGVNPETGELENWAKEPNLEGAPIKIVILPVEYFDKISPELSAIEPKWTDENNNVVGIYVLPVVVNEGGQPTIVHYHFEDPDNFNSIIKTHKDYNATPMILQLVVLDILWAGTGKNALPGTIIPDKTSELLKSSINPEELRARITKAMDISYW